MNQAQFDIDKARRAEKRGDFESYQRHIERAEEKGQKADDNYFNRMVSLVGIKQKSQDLGIRRQELKANETARNDLKNRQLQLNAEKEFRDNMEAYGKSSEGILARMDAAGTGPKAAAAKASIAAKEKELREGAYRAANTPSSSSVMSAADRILTGE